MCTAYRCFLLLCTISIDVVTYVMCCGISCLVCLFCFFFFKQKTAYEMRISDWSSDVCSSDLIGAGVDRHLWQSEAEMHRLTRGGLEDIGQPDRADRDMHLQPLHAHAGRQGENRTGGDITDAAPFVLCERRGCRASEDRQSVV